MYNRAKCWYEWGNTQRGASLAVSLHAGTLLGPYLYLGWNDGGIAQRQVGRLDNSFVSLHAGT